jgi:hypothetical protein
MGPTFGGGMEGLQEWRVGVGIWRSMENEGTYRGITGVGFLPEASKFWSRGPYRGPHWSCCKILQIDLATKFGYLNLSKKSNGFDKRKIILVYKCLHLSHSFLECYFNIEVFHT